jgi:hypothetical protein
MAPLTRVLVGAAVVVVVALGAFFGLRALWNIANQHVAYDHCTVGDYEIDTGQAAVASTMVGVVAERKLPERAAVLALAAGLQESKLRNLPPDAGDRDSVGVLQQRPSQGWGSPAQLNDVHYATGKFLDALMKVPHWQSRDLADAVQAVQISADGSAYAKHEGEAQALADALLGRTPAGINCEFVTPTKVAPVRSVAAQVHADLPVNTPSTSGREVRVPGASWQTAAWFVANANRLGIDQVSYDGKRWTRSDGWRSAPAGKVAVVATMYELKG